MTNLNLEQAYKQRIDAIWSKQIANHPETKEEEVIKLGYAIERHLNKGDVLFLGMNPSYKPGRWNHDGGGFYNVSAGNSYFQAMIDFCQETLDRNDISHHDIFFIRHTEQKSVIKLTNQEEYKDFFDEQLELTRDIIRAAEPRLIVVLNAGVREYFKRIFPFDWDKDFNDNLGAHLVRIKENAPVLFSGMLSGQRAMDLGTKRALRWHIQHIINHRI